MAWSTPVTKSTGTFVTAADYNQEVVDNTIAVRTGALAMTNQAADHFVMASSATQLAVNRDEQALFFMETFN